MNKREKTISAVMLLQMLHYMKMISIDSNLLLKDVGIPVDILDTPNVRIAADKYMEVQRKAVQLSHDPWFGLNMGTVAEVGNWGILGYVAMNCGTVEQVLTKMNRYLKAISDMIAIDLQPYGDGVKILFSMCGAEANDFSHCIETSLSSQMHLLRKLTVNPLSSVEVHFPYPEPESRELHERIFGLNISFNQPCYALILFRQALETPIISGNPQLLDYFEQYAQQCLEEAENFPPFTQSVSNEIVKMLSGGVPLIGEVARALSISVRGLQGHLKQEGITYGELLKHIRIKQMEQYLKQGLSVDEISFLLGFSEASVFRKACKKWTGLTPKQYRWNT